MWPGITLLEMAALDDVLPEFHFRERHSTRVEASPERVFDAVRSVTLAEMPVARMLMRMRGMQAATNRPVLQEAMRGFTLLADDPGRELVIGSVAQPWRLRGGRRPEPGTDFLEFRDPGYAKMAMSFRLNGAMLTTETRVLLTDGRARRRFRAYWLVIRPFSGLVRRVWLRAIVRRAELVPGGQGP